MTVPTSLTPAGPPARPKRLLMLAFDGMELLDFAGPFEVFTTANRMAQRARQTEAAAAATPSPRHGPWFDLGVASPDGRMVTARAGLPIGVDGPLAAAPACDMLLVPGGVVDALLVDPPLLQALAARADAAEHVASVCTGAFVLAAAGVLRTGEATTHWEDAADLAQRFPGLTVRPERRWVSQGKIHTSAGIAAGIDLSLHLVRQCAGAALARRTARQMDTPWPDDEAPCPSLPS